MSEQKDLAAYNETKRRIEQANSIPELKEIISKAEALVRYAKQIRDKPAAIRMAELSILAQARAGHLLQAMAASGERDKGRGGDRKSRSHGATVKLDDLSLTKSQSSRWQQLARLDEQTVADYVNGCIEKNQIPRATYLRSMAADVDNNSAPDGQAKFILMDAIEYLDDQDDACFDLLITDPPYSTDVEDIRAFSSWVDHALPKLSPAGRAYIFVGAYPRELSAYLDRLIDHPSGFVFDNILPWVYRNTIGPAPLLGYKLNWQACLYLYGPEAKPLNAPRQTEQFTVQDFNAPDARSGVRYHAWQKPTDLAERLIRHAASEKSIVVDPFCGTGTFVYAAARLGHVAVGVDNDQAMLKIAKGRVMDEPGPLYIAEGFATAATIHEATGRPCVVAYSASNLVAVTGTMRKKHGAAQALVVVADNDQSGLGQRYAEAMITTSGGSRVKAAHMTWRKPKSMRSTSGC